MKRFMATLIAAVLLAVLTPVHAQQVTREGKGETIHDQLQFRLRPTQSSYRRGQKVTVSVSISNAGSKPVYVARNLGLCPTYWGGVSLTMLDSRGRELPETACGDPYRLGASEKDALRSLSDDLVLLGPGYSYSLAVTIEEVPPRPGRYRLAATFVPPSFTEEKKANLLSLPYPVFLGELKAQATIVLGQ
jgi:hypothetical protein